MKLNELKDKSPVPLLEVEVTGWEDVITYGGTDKCDQVGTLWPIKVKDDTGAEGKVKLFNDQIKQHLVKIEVGDKLIISKGWCRFFENKPELTTGKYGSIDHVKKS